MSDAPREETEPEEAITLAARYLESHRQGISSDRERALEEKIDEWESRQADVNEDDPLYQLAEDRIEKYRSKLDKLQTDIEEVERDLLEIVSEGFMATGDWMDEPLFRALNLIFFDKYSNSLVIQRHVLDEDTEFEDDDLYEISRAVRKQASEELTEH